MRRSKIKSTQNYQFLAIMGISLLTGLNSCKELRYYTPNRNPVPLFKAKGDLSIGAGVNLANKAEAFAAYAFLDHFAAYASAGGAYEKTSQIPLKMVDDLSSKSRFWNIGGGYFLNVKRSPNFRFEVYADHSRSSFYASKTFDWTNHQGPDKWCSVQGKSNRTGLVINLGRSDDDGGFQSGYSMRGSILNFYDLQISGTETQKEQDRFSKKGPYYVAEHGFFVRFRKGQLQWTNQIMMHHGFNSPGESKSPVQQFNISINFGIAYAFTRLAGFPSEKRQAPKLPVVIPVN